VVLSAAACPPDQPPDPRRVTLVPFALWCPAPGAPAPETRPGCPTAGPGDPAPVDQRSGDQLAVRSDPGPPLAAVTIAALQAAMGIHLRTLGHGDAEPLRWAITAVDPLLGLRLEGVAVSMIASPAPADSGAVEGGE
jgi:hypothetical protein